MRFYLADARPDQREMLADLYRECRRHSDVPLAPDYFAALAKADIFRNTWDEHFAAKRQSVARVLWDEDGNRPAGFYCVGVLAREKWPTLPNLELPQACGELGKIYLLPGYQGKMLGQALYRDALCALRGLGYENYLACTYQDNSKARAFYERIGATLFHEMDLAITLAGREWHRPICFYRQSTSEAHLTPELPIKIRDSRAKKSMFMLMADAYRRFLGSTFLSRS